LAPAGAYTYGDGAHLHAVTAVSAGYCAAYDAAGNMTRRAPTSAVTCAGTQTGAQLGRRYLQLVCPLAEARSRKALRTAFMRL
jgi:hypothetical protein